MSKPTGEEMAKLFADFVNVMDDDPKRKFAEVICYNTHRTLQQSVFSTFLECVKIWAKMYEDEMYDLRNEQTCKMAHEIKELFEGLLYVPTI